MRDLSKPLAATLAAVFETIDSANAQDPSSLPAGPTALVQGRLASEWLSKLDATAGPELAVASRAHHLRRWELARADYSEGRSGYLTWRRENKAHQAASAATILEHHGWPPESIDRVGDLLRRTRLRSDAETQALEDVACLVFLETQFSDMVARTEHEHMVSIVTKTLRKMSVEAIALAGTLPLDEGGQRVIADAVAALETSDAE
ncbi:MAG: DUF4202 domain-containing protein [Actinomycetota bacterium]